MKSPSAGVVPLRNVTERQTGGPDDADLVRRALEGAESARAELFRRNARELLALLTRLLGTRADAEDALQDTFVVAFRDLHALRDPGAVAGWLRMIAVHQAQRRFRRRRMLSLLGMSQSEPDATLDVLADPTGNPEVRAELGLIDRALKGISPGDRLAWMLRWVEGYELTEVARLCGCSLATVKRRIQAAHAHVTRHVGLEEDLHVEAP